MLTTDAGRTVALTDAEIDHEHLDWGYALTVHCTQAATVGRAHGFPMVAADSSATWLCRAARERSTVHAVADGLDQAMDDIRTDWASDRRQHWLTHTTAVWAPATTATAS